MNLIKSAVALEVLNIDSSNLDDEKLGEKLLEGIKEAGCKESL